MSVSEVEICNLALQEIGDESIISLSDNSVSAQQCNLRYNSARRSALESHTWNFAMRRASLALTDKEDPFGDFNSIFTLPSDCIRVVKTDREDEITFGTDPLFNGFKTVGFTNTYAGRDRYRIEGRNFFYDDDTALILFISDVTDTTQFSPLFVDALALYLAHKIAYKLTGSRTLEADLLQRYERTLREAKLRDAQEGTIERSETSRFLSVRS